MIHWSGQPGSTATMPDQAYEQVAADLERRIREGEFAPGSRLPSRAQLRIQYARHALGAAEKVSGSVIDKAMLILKMKGLTETLPGVAVLVADPLPPA